MAQIKVEDVKEVITEMLNQNQIVNKDSICMYMGLDPIECYPPTEEGGMPKYIYNNNTIYGCINKLRQLCIEWRNKKKEYYEEWKSDFKKAAKWDPNLRKLIMHNTVMTYKTFFDKRMESLNLSKGMFLIPVKIKIGINSITTYIKPNKEEERRWAIRNSESKGKGFRTTLITGGELGYIDLDRSTRKFLDKLGSGKFLKYKKIESEDLDSEEEIERENEEIEGEIQ